MSRKDKASKRQGRAPSASAGDAAPSPTSREDRGSKPGGEARSFALVGHRGAGKTQLAEQLLAAGGVVRSPGRVDDGTSLLDHDPLARARRQTLSPAVAWIPWRDRTLYLVDTPGTPSRAWVGEVARAGTDLDVVVISAVDGVERGAEEALADAVGAGRAAAVVVTKVDRLTGLTGPTGGVADRVAEVAAACARPVVPLQVPWFDGGRLRGVVDLLSRCVVTDDDDVGGLDGHVPAAVAAEVAAAREALMEAIATTDDALVDVYLELLELPTELAWEGLARATRRGQLVPLLWASGVRAVGAGALLDLVWEVPQADLPTGTGAPGGAATIASWIGALPTDDGDAALMRVWAGELDPRRPLRHVDDGAELRIRKVYRVRGPRRALATDVGAGHLVVLWEPPPGRVGDVYADVVPAGRDELALPGATSAPSPMAWRWVKAARAADEERLRVALGALERADPSLRHDEAPRRGGVVVAGLSEGQLDLVVDALGEAVPGGLRVGAAPVRYLEQLARPVQGARGLHRVEGGDDVIEMGDCTLDVAPVAVEKGFEFANTVDEDDLPRRFAAAVGEGARRGLRAGPLAGYPVIGVRATCVAGDYHALESTEAHFERAGELAMGEALRAAGTSLLEPWSDVRVWVPGDAVGAVLTLIAGARGRVAGLEVEDVDTEVHAWMPDREVLHLAARLEAAVGRRARFVASPSHHERLPDHLVADVIAEAVACGVAS